MGIQVFNHIIFGCVIPEEYINEFRKKYCIKYSDDDYDSESEDYEDGKDSSIYNLSDKTCGFKYVKKFDQNQEYYFLVLKIDTFDNNDEGFKKIKKPRDSSVEIATKWLRDNNLDNRLKYRMYRATEVWT